MKLGTKIFFCVTMFFSLIFLLGGYTIFSCFFEAAMEREVENAAEQYQYNKFVVQAALITKGGEWFDGIASGQTDIGVIASDLVHSVAVYKPDGTALYCEFPVQPDISGLIKDAGRDKVVYRFCDIGGRKYILVAGMIAQGDTALYLVTGVNVERILRQQKQMQGRFGAIYAGAAAIGMALIFVLSMLLTRPIKRLTEAAQSITGGNYAQRIAVTGTDEVGQLAESFNRMAEAVEEKMRELSDNARQKEDFVANFAHELKTPLTSIIGYSNRIYQKELPREEQRSAAFYIWNEGMRLESLAYKLMELANLKNGEFVLQRVDAGALLRELTGDADYFVGERNAQINYEAEDAAVFVEYDLFKSLFLNLIDNALKAGADRIRVTGVCAGQGEEARYRIGVEDNGSGIPAEDLQRIKEAFYMVDKSRSRKQHGAGIGLSLAEKIAVIHGGRLEFESDGQTGTRAFVELRRAGGEPDA